MDFDKAFSVVVGHEGGYSDDYRDRGNWTSGVIGTGVLKGTKYGIAAHTHPTLDIKNLTLEQARGIYRHEYWDDVRCDEMPWPLSLYVFDCAVNSGAGAAIKFLQEALGVAKDGVLGPQTIDAASKVTKRQLAKFLALRAKHYATLSTFDLYANGWLTRLFSLALER